MTFTLLREKDTTSLPSLQFCPTEIPWKWNWKSALNPVQSNTRDVLWFLAVMFPCKNKVRTFLPGVWQQDLAKRGKKKLFHFQGIFCVNISRVLNLIVATDSLHWFRFSLLLGKPKMRVLRKSFDFMCAEERRLMWVFLAIPKITFSNIFNFKTKKVAAKKKFWFILMDLNSESLKVFNVISKSSFTVFSTLWGAKKLLMPRMVCKESQTETACSGFGVYSFDCGSFWECRLARVS